MILNLDKFLESLGISNEYCVKIAPHIEYYRKQIAYYNQTAADILTNELALILCQHFLHETGRREVLLHLL